MDQRERISDFETGILSALSGFAANLWTALPGIVQDYDATKLTCTIQPAIQARLRSAKGEFTWVKLPLLVDVPVLFPSGGDFIVTLPVKKDDEALVIFSSRCIDAWWQQGGVQLQAELRMHDLSDGFAIVGPRSQPNKLDAVSTTSVQIRNKAGDAYLELAPGGVVNIKAPGGLNVNGNVHVTGTTDGSAEGTFNGHTVSNHHHGGVQAGGANTGLPIG